MKFSACMSAIPCLTASEAQTLQSTHSLLAERKTKMRRRWFGALILIMVLLVACGGPPASEAPTSAPAAPAATAAPAAPAATAAPAEPAATAAPAAGASGEVARKDILVIPSNVNIPAPDIWNPYIPGTFILQGMNQNLMEPLFMLNYETGKIDGWLAESYKANDKLDEWTVTLRKGTEWSDGKPLTAEDVVFTINMLKQYAPQLNWSGAVKQWVQSVQAVDDRTIKFTLT